MRFRLGYVCLLVSSLLMACGPTPPVFTPTAPAPPPTFVPPTPASYPGGTPPLPTSPPLGYPGSAPIAIIYRDYEIFPSALSIVAGTPIQFWMPSENVAAHQPYSDSALNAFEAPSLLRPDAVFEFTFTQPGVVMLLCKVHLEMRATLTVVQP